MWYPDCGPRELSCLRLQHDALHADSYDGSSYGGYGDTDRYAHHVGSYDRDTDHSGSYDRDARPKVSHQAGPSRLGLATAALGCCDR